MNLPSLLGPKFDIRVESGSSIVRLRPLTTDIEVLFDGLDALTERWNRDYADRAAEAVDRYSSIRGDFSKNELGDLGAYDRERFSISRVFHDHLGPARSVTIHCAEAMIRIENDFNGDDGKFLGEYVVRNSSMRTRWNELRFLVPAALIAAVVVGYVGLTLTVAMSPFAHLLIIGVGVLTIASGVSWTRAIQRRWAQAPGNIRLRARSRRETNAERANSRANLRVAFWTAIVVIPATLLTTWLASFL